MIQFYVFLFSEFYKVNKQYKSSFILYKNIKLKIFWKKRGKIRFQEMLFHYSAIMIETLRIKNIIFLKKCEEKVWWIIL